jgi:hypothetical protein
MRVKNAGKSAAFDQGDDMPECPLGFQIYAMGTLFSIMTSLEDGMSYQRTARSDTIHCSKV